MEGIPETDKKNMQLVSKPDFCAEGSLDLMSVNSLELSLGRIRMAEIEVFLHSTPQQLSTGQSRAFH